MATAFVSAGALLLPNSAIIRPSLATWWAIQGGAAGGAWAAWNASSEAGISSDNIFAIFGEGGNGANEVGEGGNLAAADRTWTQQGAIPGDGTKRTLDGATQWFDVTTAFRDYFAGATKYGIMFKLEDWNPDTNLEALIKWAGTDIGLRVHNNPYPLYCEINSNSTATTANGITTAGVIYVYLGCNGVDTRVGFTSSGSGAGGQPAAWADFATNDRVSHGSALAMPGAMSEADPDIFRNSTANDPYAGTKWHWAAFCNNDPLITF